MPARQAFLPRVGAEKSYRALLVESRRGANVTEDEIALFDGKLRKVLPEGSSYFKATSFNDLDQDDVALLMSHVNSYPRKTNSDETPFDAFSKACGADFIEEVFDIVRIAPNDVTLKPSLLGIEVKLRK